MTDNIKLVGGSLSVEQLNAIFETIPQFKRTEKDIGKTVFEVHPGHSQGHVKAVLKQMHEGKRGKLSIMIHKDGIPVNIAFYSLHNDQGKYLGCIEVTQPVADLQEKGSKWRNVWNMIFKKK